MRRLLLLLMLSIGTLASATVPNVPFSVSYTCTGSVGPFAFTFPISDPTAMTVTMNSTLLVSNQYTIVPVNNSYNNGGAVTLNNANPCQSGWQLVLARDTPITQTTQFYDNMPTPMKQFERGLDKLTEISQEIEASAAVNNLPDPVGHSGQYLGSNGTVYALSTPPGGGNVTGPGVSVANHIAAYTDTTGTLLKDSGLLYTNLPTMASAAAGSGNVIVSAGADRTQQDSGVALSALGLPTQSSHVNQTLITSGAAASWVAGKPMFNCKQLSGVVCNGTSEGPAFQSALNALNDGVTTHGAVVQLMAGEIPNVGTTAITVPVGVCIYGTGLSTGSVGFANPLASSYITTACSDTNGCFKWVGQGSACVDNLTVVNNGSSPCFFVTKTTMTPLRANCIGSTGSNTTNNAVNDELQLGEPGTTTCSTDEHCYYNGHHAKFELYGAKVRRYIVANGVAQMFDYTVHVDSTSSDSSADASVIAGACNDAGNKCGFSVLSCATNDVVTLAITGGATATVVCTGSNAIANGTAITVTYPGNGYTSSPTTATGTCGGTCNGAASLTTTVLGPMVDLLGNAAGNVLQTHGLILGEFGNPGNHTNPGDAHYSSVIHCSNQCTENNALAMGDDSSTLTPAWAVFNQESSAQSNHFECWYRQTLSPAVMCHSADGSYGNLWDDPNSSTREANTYLGAHAGKHSAPFNDMHTVALAAEGAGATLSGTGACATRTTQVGAAWAGSVECTGSSGASTLVITPGSTATHGWSCWGSDGTTAAIGIQTTTGTTSCTLTFSSVSSNDVITFGGVQY